MRSFPRSSIERCGVDVQRAPDWVMLTQTGSTLPSETNDAHVTALATPPNRNKRARASRRNVLRAGRVNFADGSATCTVRNISATGALIEVATATPIPKDLHVGSRNGDRRAALHGRLAQANANRRPVPLTTSRTRSSAARPREIRKIDPIDQGPQTSPDATKAAGDKTADLHDAASVLQYWPGAGPQASMLRRRWRLRRTI
jgi:hypothetical protein